MVGEPPEGGCAQFVGHGTPGRSDLEVRRVGDPRGTAQIKGLLKKNVREMTCVPVCPRFKELKGSIYDVYGFTKVNLFIYAQPELSIANLFFEWPDFGG